ncbi:SdrD B-like domain-containing protein [Leucothrix arctica]|nr:SdrD B-like domain-containing protein [Leucothrix arctica]
MLIRKFIGVSTRAVVLCFFMVPASYADIPSLEFGPFGQGLLDGTSPFGTAVEDASGDLVACPTDTDTQIAGADCGDANYVVRTQDVSTHLFSISANGGDPSIPVGENVIENVVLELTAHPSTDAEIAFNSLPIACSELGGGGDDPASTIVINSDRSITMTCNLGGLSEGQAKFLSIPIQPSGLSANGSSYTTTQRIYSTANTDGSATSTVNTYEDSTPVIISAAPAWDLLQSTTTTSTWRNDGTGYADVGQGTELGFYASTWIRVAATRTTGIESITEPLTFSSVFSATIESATGTSYSPEFHVISCEPNTAGFTGLVYGSGGGNASVTDSGDCTFSRTDASDATSPQYDFTITGADLSGTHWPTEDTRGNDLSAGPYYATDHRMRVFIPMRTIDAADGVDDDFNGALWLTSLLTDFDPTSDSNTSNFGDGFEPGYNGELIDGERSNNQLGSTLFEITASGSFTKYMAKTINDNAINGITWASSSAGAGDAELENGSSAATRILFRNNGTLALTNIGMCDVFDNTTYQLTDRSNTNGSAGTYAYLGTRNTTTGSVSIDDMIVEYAYINVSGDDPLDNNNDGSFDFNTDTGRYEGDWSNQKAAVCDDSSASSGWYSDASLVPGGIDSINAVRLRQSDASIAANEGMTPTQYITFVVPLMVRQNFNGGPHDGDIIPPGTVMANFATARSDELWDSWLTQNYEPSPENTSSRGDRISMSRARLALDSFSLSPEASSGSTASTLAGNEVVWQVNTTLLTELETSVDAENLQIFSVLPPEASYNSTCTASQSGATPPNLIQYNTDIDGNTESGYTRLVWNLGTVTANSSIDPRVFCTDTDALAADGTSVILESLVQADDVFTTQSLRHDTHTISLLQVGDVKVTKTVDAALDDRNDDQVYTLKWSNFSDLVEIDKPVIIDRLPYSGDDNVPASSFSGSYSLIGEPPVSWLDGSTPASGELALGTWYYTSDTPSGIIVNPDNNVSNWCLESDFGTAGCPADFAGVTAIKFISNYDLAKNGDVKQGVIATVTLQAGDPTDVDTSTINYPSDIYTNFFTFDSASLPADQFLQSGYASVQVASYSLGDLVFADVDGDGKYDASIDYPAPNGTVVNLYKSDGTLVQSTTLGAEQNGRYLFQKVDTGDFYVEIPASEFQLGKTMANWTPATPSTDPNTEENESVDQHAYTVGTSVVNGIRSGVITLSADAATAGGGVPTGHEPTADNTANLTDSTLDDFSNFTLDVGINPATYNVSGTVWSDSNKNGIRENSELGIPNVTVVLYGAPYDEGNERCVSLDTDANGFYQFEDVIPGSYQLIESDASDTPFGSATCPPAAGDPDEHISTTPNTRNITVYQTDLTRQDFGDFAGISVSGTVFHDNGLNGGTSGNQSQEGDEPGIGGVTMTASDGAGTVYDTTTTNTDGSYTLHVPATATTVVVTESNASGYVSIGGEVGTTGGTYSLANDTTTFTLSAATTYTGINFADIQSTVLEPNHTGTVQPGNVIFYAHTFTTPTAGTVVFSHDSDLNVTQGWSNLLYRDTDCSGTLNGTEADVVLGEFNLGVNAGDKICIINKVYAPNNVAAQDRHRVTITANFSDNSGGGSQMLTAIDVTTAGQSTLPTTDTSGVSSSLELRKSVQNITKNTAATESSNDASPGDILKYRITYRNKGTGPITDLVVNDSVPAYTTYDVGTANCDSTPAGMTCLPTVSGSAVDWKMTGSLSGGASGQVSYQVVLDK